MAPNNPNKISANPCCRRAISILFLAVAATAEPALEVLPLCSAIRHINATTAYTVPSMYRVVPFDRSIIGSRVNMLADPVLTYGDCATGVLSPMGLYYNNQSDYIITETVYEEFQTMLACIQNPQSACLDPAATFAYAILPLPICMQLGTYDGHPVSVIIECPIHKPMEAWEITLIVLGALAGTGLVVWIAFCIWARRS